MIINESSKIDKNNFNVHEKEIYKLMDSLTQDFIGGNENTLMDYEEDSEEYQNAKEFLNQGHSKLAKFFYDLIMKESKRGSNSTHLRFAGSEFLRTIIEDRLKEWGY